MERTEVEGLTVEYEARGSGEPVVFIHGALMVGTFGPMMREPALKGFRLVRYSRRGYSGSKGDPAVPLARLAADCAGLLRKLDALPAHVVGHSSGGAIALQLALDAPEVVRSLTLFEPALLDVASGPPLLEKLGATVPMYEAGDRRGAVDAFLQGACGKEYRSAVEKALPGAMEQAVADAPAFFEGEFPALGGWTFTRDDAARIEQRVLTVLGARSEATWRGWAEGHERLLEWFPQAKPFVLQRAGHLLQVENPRDMAEGLAAFLKANGKQ